MTSNSDIDENIGQLTFSLSDVLYKIAKDSSEKQKCKQYTHIHIAGEDYKSMKNEHQEEDTSMEISYKQ